VAQSRLPKAGPALVWRKTKNSVSAGRQIRENSASACWPAPWVRSRWLLGTEMVRGREKIKPFHSPKDEPEPPAWSDLL
jgi:hypothetical protein